MGVQHVVTVVASVGLAGILAAGFGSVRSAPVVTPIEPELATSMGDLQRHTHKLMLSIAARNPDLSDFYLHEVDEIAAQLQALFPDHDGIPVAALVAEMLVPRVEALRGALGGRDWDAAQGGVDALVEGCNACHAAAGHAFIRVERTTENPFNQRFDL